jgi:hypothetical protein
MGALNMPIDPKSVKWDAPDPASIKWDEPEGFAQKMGRQVLNAGAGALRGAGSIGATILTPYDLAVGNTKSIGNPERRQAMTDALQTMGADTNSLAFQGGKLGGEIAGTLGVGGTLARGASMLPGAARMAPVVDAIGSAGFKAAGATGLPGLAARTAGGAITGGAAAGLVDPDQAGMGAVIGGALPGVAQGAGMLGRKVGETLRGPAQSADMVQAIQQARGAGYVIPPTQANPTLGNRIIEGMSGKLTTAQNASAKNQAVTGKLAAEALGLPGDTKLTPDVLKTVRQQAGQAFESLRQTGMVQADQTYDQALNAIIAKYQGAAGGFPGLAKPEVESLVTTLRQPIFSADSAVDAVRVLREKADAAYGAGDKGLGKAIKEAAKALEDQMERHLSATGQPAAVLDDFRKARQLIAKTYTVEKALNPATGAVDARTLAAQLKKGAPLSGDLKTAAEFAARFPKASQTVEGMGSLPQTSPLDWVPAGALSMATSNPLMMLGVGARPAARALALSPVVQNRLVQSQAPNALQQLLANPEFAQLGYRAAPNALNGR